MWNMWIIFKSYALMVCHCNFRTCCSLQISKHADDTTVFPRYSPGRTIFTFVQKWISSWSIVCRTFCGLLIKTQSSDNYINQEWLRQCELSLVWQWRNVNTKIRIYSPFLLELKTLGGIFHGINKILNSKIIFWDKDAIIEINQNEHIIWYEYTWAW